MTASERRAMQRLGLDHGAECWSRVPNGVGSICCLVQDERVSWLIGFNQ